MKKNIAFYVGDFTRTGGTERSGITVANGLAKKHDNIFLLAANNPEEKSFFQIDDNITVLYINKYNSKKDFFSVIKNILHQCKKNKIEVVVAVEIFSLLFIFPAFLLGKLSFTKFKLVAWEHLNFNNTLDKPLRAKLRKIAARYADLIVVLTKRDMHTWKENVKIKQEITQIYNAAPFVNDGNLYNTSSKNIIAVGRLDYIKGFDKLLKIWKLFQDKGFSDWTLQLIGSGPELPNLQKIISDFNLQNTVEMIPNTNNVKSFYENAAFIMMTSRFEGLPMTLIEAQVVGLPIISYDFYTGPAEVISSASGFLVENDNEDMIVEKMMILCQGENLRMQMSDHAKIESSRFGTENVVAHWETALDGL